MFLGAYIGFLFSAIALWYIITRVTKSEGLDWWDAAGWIAGAYIAALAVRGLAYLFHFPDVLSVVLQVLVGLTVLDWFLRDQYGQANAIRILVYFIGIRLLFALPWVLIWYLSLSETNP